MSKEVIETFFLDWIASFGIGALFAIAGRNEITAVRAPLRSRTFAFGIAYFELGFVSIALAYYVARPDWMWMYWVRASGLPIAIVVLAFAMYQLAFVAGFAIAASLPRREAIGVAIADGCAVIALEALARTRLGHFGTFDEFNSGTSVRMLETAGGWLLLTIAVVSIAALGWTLRAAARRAAAPV